MCRVILVGPLLQAQTMLIHALQFSQGCWGQCTFRPYPGTSVVPQKLSLCKNLISFLAIVTREGFQNTGMLHWHLPPSLVGNLSVISQAWSSSLTQSNIPSKLSLPFESPLLKLLSDYTKKPPTWSSGKLTRLRGFWSSATDLIEWWRPAPTLYVIHFSSILWCIILPGT